jgi:hypothetical protein
MSIGNVAMARVTALEDRETRRQKVARIVGINSLDESDADVLRSAAHNLNTLWSIEAGRGLCDSLGGAEYQRVSLAPRLRAMADKIDPPEDAS